MAAGHTTSRPGQPQRAVPTAMSSAKQQQPQQPQQQQPEQPEQPEQQRTAGGSGDVRQDAIDRGAHTLALFGSLLGLHSGMVDEVVARYRAEFESSNDAQE